jgi:hypothetical protein
MLKTVVHWSNKVHLPETREEYARFEVSHCGDYEECRLLGYKTQFVPHRIYFKSPLEWSAG